MYLWLAVWLLVAVITIRTINYGRWVGRKGNKGGAIGLYILSLITVAVPVLVYLLHNLR